MGSLTPGVKLIYESPDGGKTVYAREEGSTKRKLVGKMFEQNISDYIKDSHTWWEIKEAAKTNPALQNAINNVILIYQLSKENDE